MAAKHKAVRKDNSAEAKEARKESKRNYNQNKGKIRAKAKRDYKSMTPKEKKLHLENGVRLKALRHGATDAEAEKVVREYRLNKRRRAAGKHASGKIKAAQHAQRQVRENIRSQAGIIRKAHEKALNKIKKSKVSPQDRAKLRQAEKQRYAADRKKLAGLRKSATKGHKKLMEKIKSKGGFRMSKLISNYSKTPISKRGKRIVTVSDTPHAIAERNFTVKKTRGRPKGSKNKPKETAAAPAAAPKATRGRPKGSKNKPKEVAAPAEAPKKTRGRPAGSKNKPKETAAPAPAAAAPKATRGRPKGSKNKPKETAAAPAAVATKAPVKKTTTKAPVKKTESKKAEAKAPAKTGGAVPKKSSNKKATLS